MSWADARWIRWRRDTERAIAAASGGASVTWSTLSGKPSTFPPSAHVHHKSQLEPRSPALTYTAGKLTRVDYGDESYKTFTYTGDQLDRVDWVVGSTTYRKTFTYNPDGTLASVAETTL